MRSRLYYLWQSNSEWKEMIWGFGRWMRRDGVHTVLHKAHNKLKGKKKRGLVQQEYYSRLLGYCIIMTSRKYFFMRCIQITLYDHATESFTGKNEAVSFLQQYQFFLLLLPLLWCYFTRFVLFLVKKQKTIFVIVTLFKD